MFHHTAITYGAIGGWYYKELLPSPTLGSRLLVLFCTVNQAWFMGLFFLLAGYYTPPAAIFDDEDALREWADRAYAAARTANALKRPRARRG